MYYYISMDQKKFSLNISPEDYHEWKLAAAQRSVSVGYLVRIAVQRYIRHSHEAVLRDENGHFFLTITERTPNTPIRYGEWAADVYIDTISYMSIAHDGEKLVHWVNGNKRYYTADELMELDESGNTPQGLTIQPAK